MCVGGCCVGGLACDSEENKAPLLWLTDREGHEYVYVHIFLWFLW